MRGWIPYCSKLGRGAELRDCECQCECDAKQVSNLLHISSGLCTSGRLAARLGKHGLIV